NGFDSRTILPSQVRRLSMEQEKKATKPDPTLPEVLVPPQKPFARETTSPASHRKEKRHRRSSSRSFTGSSEEYLSLDEQSNITTPAGSRPQSQKGQSASSTSNDSASHGYESKVKEAFSRTALPIDFEDDTESTKTP